jgi:hypothetical protein
MNINAKWSEIVDPSGCTMTLFTLEVDGVMVSQSMD